MHDLIWGNLAWKPIWMQDQHGIFKWFEPWRLREIMLKSCDDWKQFKGDSYF